MSTAALPPGYANASVAIVVALIGVLTAWQLASTSLEFAVRLGLLGALAAPLLATLPGLLRRKVYTARWASLLSIAYIGIALTESVVSTDERLLTSAMAGLSFAMFGALVLGIRRARPV
ncbi:MAG: DUF2069 domain-containing protein [Pseudomonadota bacterium]